MLHLQSPCPWNQRPLSLRQPHSDGTSFIHYRLTYFFTYRFFVFCFTTLLDPGAEAARGGGVWGQVSPPHWGDVWEGAVPLPIFRFLSSNR